MPAIIPSAQAGYTRYESAPQARNGPRTDYEITGYTVDFIRARPDECVLVSDDDGVKWRIPQSVVTAISDRGFDSGVSACQSTHATA
ncbi:MAG: hypothetical protein JOZ48_20675 [Acidobacteriaceae bacterium]|nr:hypothetical protein [Acidobacteriaceae bacterium]